MLDLIKTFIYGIWIEKKYRYLFIFIVITLVYKMAKWMAVFWLFEMSPVVFNQINNDGSLSFQFAKKYEQSIYPKDYQLPTKAGKKNKNYDIKKVVNTKKCEAEYFAKIYIPAVNSLIKSSADSKFLIYFYKKIPKKVGDVSYFNNTDKEKYIYETLYKQGIIFHKLKDVNYCEIMKKYDK